MMNIMLPLRGAQLASTTTVLGLTAYVTNWWSTYWRDMAPIEFTFLLFSSTFSLLTTVYLLLAALNKLPAMANNKFALLAADAMTMMFWLGGSIALAVFLSARVCFGNVCNVAKASVAFGGLNWALFTATTIWAAMYTFRKREVTPPPKTMEEGVSPS